MTTRGWRSAAERLPIADTIDPLLQALRSGTRVVLHAPPGAGKTTIVPLALREQDWCQGSVVVLEPRRLAVRAAATRLAELSGDRPGQSVGWRMRHDTRVSAETRIEVVTEGVLTRRLQNDPGLDGVSAIVFDEFHERSLDADLGLALTLEAAEALRPDLRIVVMSATLDTAPIAQLLDGPVVESHGRAFPVDIVHVDTDRQGRMEPAVAATVKRALAAEHGGDVLVFLPGAAEIDRTRRALDGLSPGLGPDIDIRPLYGAMPPAAQDAAIAPAPPGRRKVVLSTSIAETSLTIEGVVAVVDAGWRRTPRFDPNSGMTRLATLPVTKAEADQRAGRAGRLGPGIAYRLWARSDHAALRSHPEPEIEVTDLAGLALELSVWGTPADELAWLDPPPEPHLAAARDLLHRLGALDAGGVVTAHGRTMARLPVHPRLVHLLIRGAELGHGAIAADVAAVLGEPALRRGSGTDLTARLTALRHPRDGQRAAAERARTDAARFRRLVKATGDPQDSAAALVAALGFPDRIGAARAGQRGDYLLSGGRGAFVDGTDPIAAADYLVAVELDGRATRSRIFLGAPLSEEDVRTVAAGEIDEQVDVRWDERRHDVVAERTEGFGAVVLSRAPIDRDDVDAGRFRAALLDGLRAEGVDLLPWTDELRQLQARMGFLHRHRPDQWPAVDDDSVLQMADDRIGPFLEGMRRRRDLRSLDMREVLLSGLDWSRRDAIDRLAPTRLQVPSGNRHRVDYSVDPPVLAVKLQEMFGSTETPTVLDGAVPVVLHLLSPAGRPLQITQDLATFWTDGYSSVRADMRGRYPKHPWPEDPTSATPTSSTKGRKPPT